ncbi:MAG: hypothetical protein ACRDRJ_11805 [Streptosporangiaceae bacterium]
MTVVALRLSGLDAAAARAVVDQVLAHRETYPVLDRTLVIDDASALISHATAFERLLRSRRLDHLLCVAVGLGDPHRPRHAPPAVSPRLRIPANLGSGRGSAVVWVGDPRGIDCGLSASARADGHTGSTADGLEYLVDVLSVDDVFDKVRELVRGMPNGAASPGLRLADADDEGAAFTAALALAIDRLNGPGSGPGAGTPVATLLPGATGMAGLVPAGDLASSRDRIASAVAAASAALAKPSGGFLRQAAPDVSGEVIAIGNDLSAFRERVTRLLTEAHATGELRRAQDAVLVAAGLSLPASPDTAQSGRQDQPTAAPTLVRQTVTDAIRGGGTLPQVIRRLNLTAQQLKHAGSGAYLPEVDKACPAELLHRLASPAERPGGKTAADTWRYGLGLTEAATAASDLAALVIRVASREWSGTAAVADEVSRTRIALDGVRQKLAEGAAETAANAATAATAASGVRAARRARLSDSLAPILFDLVDKVIAAESATPSSGGQEAFERAQDKTAELITDWTRHAAENGATSRPAFATTAGPERAYADDDLATLREALRQDPMGQMWQLCEPDDLGVLDVGQVPRLVAFASRMDKDALGPGLPDDMTWISSGSHAGLLRLVSLRLGTVWAGDEPPGSAELAS